MYTFSHLFNKSCNFLNNTCRWSIIKKRKNTCRWPYELLLGGDFTTLVWIITWSFFNCPTPPPSLPLKYSAYIIRGFCQCFKQLIWDLVSRMVGWSYVMVFCKIGKLDIAPPSPAKQNQDLLVHQGTFPIERSKLGKFRDHQCSIGIFKTRHCSTLPLSNRFPLQVILCHCI